MKTILFAILLASDLFAHSHLIKKPSNNSVKKTMDILEATLKKKGITVFSRIDHSLGAQKTGQDLLPTELLIFGNPKLGTPLMKSERLVGLDLPMKALAWKDENGKVWLAYTKPQALKERYNVTGKDAVFGKMTKALMKLTDVATK